MIEKIIDLMESNFLLFVFIWVLGAILVSGPLAYLANNWLWSGNPFAKKQADENIKRIVEHFLPEENKNQEK